MGSAAAQQAHSPAAGKDMLQHVTADLRGDVQLQQAVHHLGTLVVQIALQMGDDLRVEGVVDSLTYEDEGRGKGGFFARLLGG